MSEEEYGREAIRLIVAWAREPKYNRQYFVGTQAKLDVTPIEQKLARFSSNYVQEHGEPASQEGRTDAKAGDKGETS